MYEDIEGNMIDLLYETPTSERNGVKIIIPVDYYDRGSFLTKIKEQLAYFESVYFDVNINGSIINPFHIYRGEDFQISELSIDSKMHICLDNIYYPLDFKAIGVSDLYIPIGLKFGLSDGIFPTPNRENIRYTKEAIAIITKKIKEVADTLVKKYNETNTATTDIHEVIRFYKKKERLLKITDEISFDISEIVNMASVKLSTPTIPGITLLDLSEIAAFPQGFTQEYTYMFRLQNNRFSQTDAAYRTIDISSKHTKHIIFSEKLSGVMKDYLREIYNYQNCAFIKKTRTRRLRYKAKELVSSYFGLLHLDRYPKSQWRELILEYQYLQSLYLKDVPILEKNPIPEAWLQQRKRKMLIAKGYSLNSTKQERALKPKGAFICKEGEALGKYTGNNCKFTSRTYLFEKIPTMNLLFIYGLESDKAALDKLYYVLSKKVKVIILSPREFNIVERFKIHNLISIKTFMKGNHKPFKRFVTATLINSLIRNYRYTFDRRDSWKVVSTTIYNKLEALYQYDRKYYFNSIGDDLFADFLSIATEFNLFDPEIYDTYCEIKALLEKYYFIDRLMEEIPYNPDKESKITRILIDMCKYHKLRVNWDLYNSPEKVPVLETNDNLSEELIDELTEN